MSVRSEGNIGSAEGDEIKRGRSEYKQYQHHTRSFSVTQHAISNGLYVEYLLFFLPLPSNTDRIAYLYI